MTSLEPIARHSARVVLVDHRDRVLLFQGWDPHEPERGKWWFTPGGGLDPGETPAQGAARELFEETGLRLEPGELGPVVWQRTSEFMFVGSPYRQEEDFFFARVWAWEVDTSGFTDIEKSAMGEARWWQLDALRATRDTVYPPQLADLMPELLAGPWSGPPRRVR